jgi:arsenate reductase (thioredoxin)
MPCPFGRFGLETEQQTILTRNEGTTCRAPTTMNKTRVLILCTGNSARSQMAEGLLRHEAGDRFEVFSAGVEPSAVRPLAVRVMLELGIDISRQRSKSVDEFAGQEFDYVITVCDHANERCPVFPGKTKRIHWSFDDPAATAGGEVAQLSVFRRVRDEIRLRLRVWVSSVVE